jgi:hypothetical protein
LAWGQEYDPETGELIKDQNYPDSLVSPSHHIISVAFPQLSIKGKRIYNHEINEYYSDDEFIKRLNSDPNFVNDENFISYKKYVNRLKSKGSKCIYCFSFMSIAAGFDGINNPDDFQDEDSPPGLDNIAFGILLPLTYHTYNSDKKRKTLYNVIQRYNNLYSEEKLPDSKPPYTWSVGMSFGFQSEKTPVSLLNGYLLFRLNEHKEIFTGFGTILFGGSLFTGYKHYLNDFSKPSPYMSISYHGGLYFDSGSELIGIFPSLGFSLPISENAFLNFGIGYVFMLQNTMRDFEGKKGFLAPFLNLSFPFN